MTLAVTKVLPIWPHIMQWHTILISSSSTVSLLTSGRLLPINNTVHFPLWLFQESNKGSI